VHSISQRITGKKGLWDFFSIGLILITISLIVIRRDNFPIFVDIYYHLSITEMFDQAGGVVIHDFLQYAPIGRSHLYPPFLHILMLGAYKMGLSMDALGRLVSAVMFPLTMVSCWLLVRRAFGSAEAFVSLVLLLCSWQFFYTTAVVSASALATVLALLTYYLILTGRDRAAIVTMAFCLYSHMSYPHLVSLSLIIWALMEPARRRSVSKVLVFSYLLFSPWLINVMMNIGSVADTSALGGGVNFSLVLVASALAGAVLCLRNLRRGERGYALPLAMMMSMVPVFFFYRSRFFVHSSVPLAILGAIGLVFAARYLASRMGRHGGMAGTVFLVAISFMVLTWGVTYSSGVGGQDDHAGPGHGSGDVGLDMTTLVALADGDALPTPSYETPASESLLEDIESNTDQDDIIVLNRGINGCMITAYTGRATTSGMFHEVSTDDQRALRNIILSSGGQFHEGLEYSTVDGDLIDMPTAFPSMLAFALVGAGIFAIMYDVKCNKEEKREYK